MNIIFNAFKNLRVETQRLLISPFEDKDLKFVYEMHSNDNVNKFIPYTTWNNWDDAENWLNMIHQRRQEKEAQLFALRNKETDTLVGTSLVFNADKTNQDLNFGYVIEQTNWGQGYASEAVKGISDALLRRSEIPVLNATIQEGNVASMKVLLKIGFREISKDIEEDGTKIRRFKKAAISI